MIGVSGLTSALRLNECGVMLSEFERDSASLSEFWAADMFTSENVLLKGEYVGPEVYMGSQELGGEGGFAIGGSW